MSLASRVYECRLAVGKTAADVAREAKISRGYYSELENGKSQSPSSLVLKRIAAALETSVAYLIGEELPQSTVAEVGQLPRGLEELVDQIPYEDIMSLATIKLRGFSPDTADDWRYLYESLKRSLPKDFGQ